VLAGLQFVRRSLAQQHRGFRGPNPLGRCHPLAAASDQQHRRPLRSHRHRRAGGRPRHRHRLWGSCFQKDILNLVSLCGHYGLHEVAAYWQQVVALNTWQQHRISTLVVRRLFGTVTGKRIAVLGFVFKADNNDTRETPAIRICRDLLEEGAQLAIFDPKVSAEQIAADLGVEALLGSEGEGVWQPAADAVLLLTEWQQFRQLDWPALAAVMRQPAWVFDARAVADAAAALAAGLRVWVVGEGEG
jgi:UDPglucose 6-dehydrogenase